MHKFLGEALVEILISMTAQILSKIAKCNAKKFPFLLQFFKWKSIDNF